MAKIYLDNAASTRPLQESLDLYNEVSTKIYGNTAALHSFGILAENKANEARNTIGRCLNTDPKTIYFTSGGTESDNMAIFGAALAKKRRGNHIITTSMEHSAVYEPIKYLEENGFSVTYLPTDDTGYVSPDALNSAIGKDTVLVSIMYVNNETGVILPIEEIGKIIENNNSECIFHVDAVQAVGKLPINLKRSRVDLLSASGHKFHGIKGTGFLYKKESVRIENIIKGGGHERGLRSGTLNTPGAVAMANSLSYMTQNMDINKAHIKMLKDRFIDGLSGIEEARILGRYDDKSLPHILNVSFEGIRSEVMIHSLEEHGIYASAGAACSSHGKKTSRTLASMKVSNELIESSVRFSFSIFNTKEEIDETLKVLKEIVPILSKYKRR